MDQVDDITKSSRVPACIKKVIKAITDELSCCRVQNDELEKELELLRSKIPSRAHCQDVASSAVNVSSLSESAPGLQKNWKGSDLW